MIINRTTERPARFSGEMALMLAVLLDAVERGYEAERDWFESEEEEYLYSFRNICQTLLLPREAMLALVRDGKRIRCSHPSGWRPGRYKIVRMSASKKTRAR